MPSLMVGVPKICGLAPASCSASHGRVGQPLQPRVARRDRRVAVGHADHRLGEVARPRSPSRSTSSGSARAPTPSVMFLERRFMLMRMRPSGASGVGQRIVALVRRGPLFAATIALGFSTEGLQPMLVHPQFDPVALDFSRSAADRRALVRADLPGRVRPVPVAGARARGAAAVRRRGLDAPRRRGPAVLRRARCRDRRATGLCAVLQARLLRGASAGIVRGLEGRHGLSRRPARRASPRWRCSAACAGGRSCR